MRKQLQLSDVWIIIPAWNEGPVIAGIIQSLQTYSRHILVVDDASTDQTSHRARQAAAVVLRHTVNLGQGAALQTGLDYALSQGAKIICTFDADGQHDPSNLPLMFEVLQRTQVDIVLGSRFLGRAHGISVARRFLLKLAILYTRLTTGLKLTDTHNGLRMMNSRAASCLNIQQNRMAHASEILSNVSRYKLRWREVPITIKYTEYSRKKGQSGLNSLNILGELLMGWLRK